MTKSRLEKVTWRDAHSYMDPPEKFPKDYLCHTVGWVRQEKKFLRIESERTPESARAVTRVPLENVVKRVPLRKA